jgi:hypothetical protein
VGAATAARVRGRIGEGLGLGGRDHISALALGQTVEQASMGVLPCADAGRSGRQDWRAPMAGEATDEAQ